ncbi:alpha/beta hydrolase family protein [Nocardia sp. NRRL WC-3656]|uniref:alpha/beta hydrolase n=1 Tax=Nocardia sp. NRRL WC-3656 TaxID=1463824 RepID=UPI0005612F87|nr:alpha/beta hydrolase family protein [Nocardia sp. NRRL WC-3656]
MKRAAFGHVAALRITMALLALLVSTVPACGSAAAAPGRRPEVTDVVIEGRTWHLTVYSAAMDKEIAVDVQRPADESRPAPNLYLLNGLDAGQGKMNWKGQTTALQWLADKQVNVVQPIGGRGSYYTDWLRPDPVLGVNKWKTFFTTELPPLLDETLHSTGRNALTGLSMSGTSVLQLAEAAPGLWKTVAAYSGCAQIADPMGRLAVKLAVELWARGNTVNMYGPPDSPLWAENDPVLHAEKLRGTLLYLSSGSGIPEAGDVRNYSDNAPGPVGGANLALGMMIEGATDLCTHNLQARLDALGIPATYRFTATGTHYWPYWEAALHDSWPLLARGMGVPGY